MCLIIILLVVSLYGRRRHVSYRRHGLKKNLELKRLQIRYYWRFREKSFKNPPFKRKNDQY